MPVGWCPWWHRPRLKHRGRRSYEGTRDPSRNIGMIIMIKHLDLAAAAVILAGVLVRMIARVVGFFRRPEGRSTSRFGVLGTRLIALHVGAASTSPRVWR